VLGNTVNIASRLESAVAGSDEIAISEQTYQATREHFTFESLGEKKLTGISRPVKAYRVKGLKGAI
jgi:adenylate cyclase